MRPIAPLIWILSATLTLVLPGALAQTKNQTDAKDAPAAAQQKKTKPKSKPKAKVEQEQKDAPKPLVGEQREKRYQDGLSLESKGNNQAALMAYLEAGNAGHGQAQKKLGDIYGKGNNAVKRDYDVSLRWYEKARAQGIEIPKPHAFTKGR